ncbi:MAG: hypothetical protein IJI66_04070 [Erysipelotrichaceae bacterium]|nr:hypothetical protein [Erysipelotrichaceae bacterium]
MPNETNSLLMRNNTKAFRVLPSQGNLIDTHNLNVRGKVGNNRPITKLSFSGGNAIDGSLSDFDLLVADTVYTLTANGNPEFTLMTVVKTITGDDEANITDKRAAAVIKSLEKMSMLKISIDVTEEFKCRRIIEGDKRCVLESYFLPLETIIVVSNFGIEHIRYRLIKKPCLFEFAESLNQFVRYPISLVNDSNTRNDLETLMIKHYIIWRIQLMKNRRNNIDSNKIVLERYDTKLHQNTGLLYELGFLQDGVFYEYADNGEQVPLANQRNKRAKINKCIRKVLDSFVDKGFINGYEVERIGKTIRSYIIDC